MNQESEGVSLSWTCLLELMSLHVLTLAVQSESAGTQELLSIQTFSPRKLKLQTCRVFFFSEMSL